MDELTSGVDPDELMDLDEAEGSDLEEDDEDVIEDTLPSPLQLPSSGPASTATSAASSPPTNDDVPPVFNFTGKPMNIKRGRGRPRREGGKPAPRRQNSGVRKRWKPQSYLRGMNKRVRPFDRGDYEFASITPSPGDESTSFDPETGALVLIDKERPFPSNEELPYAPEQWPGKVCVCCNLSERSQLGQGEMLRLTCSEGFTPQRVVIRPPEALAIEHIPDREIGDKSPRGPVTCRRQKSFNKCRHPSMTSEYVDELTIIGYVEEPDVTAVFEPTGHFYIHRSCALWSDCVSRADNSALVNVDQAVVLSASKKCSHCNHFGASVSCKMGGCTKIYHYPCATASGAFQDLSTLLIFCTSHLLQVSISCEDSVCYTCKRLGDISNLMYCSLCGEHYHGTCVGLAQLPGVRAGWQCRRCKVCQVCRMVGDESKLMACETCDKVYHAMCQRPVVTTIPKYGWKCRCCRICGDCGSRTPGAGLSSRWHAHYSVCDSCYQQRNKGCSCPLCHRAYRAHAHREMVQCVLCRKFVHGTCDPEADLSTYHQRKEAHPEYDYVCPICKNVAQQGRPMLTKRNSIEDGDLSASQESLADDIYEYDPDRCGIEDIKAIGLGRGKPYSASKIAKKRLGLTTGVPGRPKGVGKGIPGKAGFMKRQKIPEFGRKRGPKAKMRGVFGVPGVGLQRPVSDGKNDDESGVENRLILCSAKDKFVLTQDICVMCGALGTDQEGCLIACVQCGQCYHPYCVNIKVTKVILQKGWHCLDCIVCQGCGQRNDEGRLLLCDDCDISYHIYCMDPPLNFVPQGTWKCKWCAICQTCGSTDPGFNCNWMNSYSECGPCASFVSCPSCLESYSEGDLIVQCLQCSRWLHGTCDSIKTEQEAEKCAEEGYNCLLCRPRDVPPPHLLPLPMPKPPTPTKSPEGKANTQYVIDGVCLSEWGNSMIKSLNLEQQITRKKRKKIPTIQDKEAGIMATIESVIASSSTSDIVDIKDEPLDIYKEGMIWGKEDGPPPEGFTLFTMENGVTVLRRKRQRNLQKLGIGGFLVRARGVRNGQDNDDIDMLPGQSSADPFALPQSEADKPRRKPIRRKPKSKLAETFPPYLQEAFFGRELLDTNKDIDSCSGSDDETSKHTSKCIQLSHEEIKAVAAVSAKHEKDVRQQSCDKNIVKNLITPKEEEESDNDDFNLAIPGELLDTDLVNTIMNEDDDELTKNTDTLENLTEANLTDDLADSLTGGSSTKDTKDELSDLLGPHFNFMPNINSKDVEDIFKGVLTDESQESQESSVFSTTPSSVFTPAAPTPQQPIIPHPIPPPVRPTTLPTVNQNAIHSPMSFPPQSPYHSEYSNSPQFSPAFSEPPSPWVTVNDSSEMDSALVPSNNQRSSEKMKADEGLGSGATISAVLYANTNHPEWKTEYPSWSDRYKQIIKKWRTLSNEQKSPFLQQAKDNRSALRMKKQQQITKEGVNSPGVSTKTAALSVSPTVSVVAPPIPQGPVVAVVPSPVSEVCTTTITTTIHHQKPLLTTASSVSIASTSTSPATPKPVSPAPVITPSPQTQQQFTVHGHFMGPGDHCGPAPNVTVNPHYQPNVEPTIPRPLPLSAAVDQQIRVLTPSEIMRTLPSLCQENYEQSHALDPEKTVLHQKSAREAEQERQWKHLQAIRQQHQQQQQQIIQEQRVQVTARVHRQLSDPAPPGFMSPEQQQSPLQQPPPEIAAPPSPGPRNFNPLGIKAQQFTHPVIGPRQQTPSPVVQPQPTTSAFDFMPNATSNIGDPFNASSAPTTPKPAPTPQPRLTPTDPYAHQPATPRPAPQFVVAQRAGVQGVVRPDGTGIENRQLRDLLQRQQFKKLDEQLLPGKGQQRVWPPPEGAETEQVIVPPVSGDSTFRHPLPPGIRTRMPLANTVNVIRSPGNIVGLRMQQSDPRLQGLDPRMRLILQHHQQQQLLQRAISSSGAIQQQQPQQQQQPPPPQFQSNNPRFPVARPAGVEQYEQIQRQVFQPRSATDMSPSRLPLNQGLPKGAPPNTALPAGGTAADATDQEIPDNVTAELEKLEQDGTMAELQVGDILGGLPDDDDELLAEMGNDFNILEYADPELDALTGGEKTNILDSLELEEPEPVKDNKKPKAGALQAPPQQTPGTLVKTEPKMQIPTAANVGQSPAAPIQQPQQLQQSTPPTPAPPPPQLSHQQLHQQMLHQVQQAAASGRPMLPGTQLMSPDGIFGTVIANNNVTLSFPPGYPQRILQQFQMAKIRQHALAQQNPRLAGPMLHGGPVGLGAPPRMPVGNPPPPPPPYPGPPPPYPGSTTPQMGLRMGPVHMMGPHRLPMGLMNPMRPQGLIHHMQRRPLLLEEQPLLLEELLEQEKREQEKQMQTQPSVPEVSSTTSSAALLSDHDFEKLKADVFSSGPISFGSSSSSNSPVTKAVLTSQGRPTYQKQVSAPVGGSSSSNQWQQPPPAPAPPAPRLTFNANLQPAPPLPPEHITTEQDKQTQIAYEEWLNHQNGALGQQLRFYENEVQKLRKLRKSLNSKQRQLKKSGNQLAENDAIELERVSQEQAFLQKHLETSRKMARQHGMLIQEYQNKQQRLKRPGPGQSPLMSQSPLGASPIHAVNTPQSPLMSPSASPMTQHSSPMHSPAPMMSQSPGPGSVTNVLQSPSNMSPRIGTPLSQSEGSPGPIQSPSQVCLPPPMPRMTSPQHRRVVTSPIGYTGDLRPGTPQGIGQLRFVRPQIDPNSLQQRTRLQSPSPNFQQKPGTPSPLNSPPVQNMAINVQLSRQFQQHVLLQQQLQQQQSQQGDNNESVFINSQRTLQLIQHRHAIRQQQQQQQQVAANQPQPLTPQQHQLMVQQQQQLAKQQQQLALQQARISQSPNSPMPPSPLVNQSQIMSPHSMHSQPASPMPPRSPIVSSSPIPRSPAIHQNQPPSSPMMHSHQPPSSPMPRSPMIGQIQSPMGMRRPPSTGNSPIIPDRPRSVENPRTPYSHHMDQEHGGGNPHNPANPIPVPMGFVYVKPGLRGGSPMWSYGRGAKKVPNGDGKEEKSNPGEISAPPPKFKKESHVDRVTILRKKSPVKSNLQTLTVNHRISLVSSDYSEFDDSSSTPPVTPPPSSSSNRSVPRSIGKKIPENSNEQAMQMIDGSPEPLSMIDYDDDNVVSTEVSLSSAAQQADSDDITVIESFSQSDLPETFSSPLESDQITDEFVLFDISGGVHYSEKEEDDEDDYHHLNDKNMQIVIQSPTTSDEELILQGKTKEADGLTLNLVEGLSADQLLVSESPTEHEEHTPMDTYEKSQIIFIDSNPKSPEEQISTKEDFEELIDEGTRKEKIIKPEIINTKHINEFHKYAANIYTYSQKVATSSTITTVKPNMINIRPNAPGQKISLITPVNLVGSKVNITKKELTIQPQKVQNSNITNIILQSTISNSRNNIITVPKIVTSQYMNIHNSIPTHFSVPVISASAVSKLPNVKVIDKPSTSLSLTTHDLPKKIFEDDSKSSDCDEDKIKVDQQFSTIKQALEDNHKKNEVVKEKQRSLEIKEEKLLEAKDDIPQPPKPMMVDSKSSPAGKTPSALMMRNPPPELKMTAQVIQESQGIIRSGTIERMPYITQTIEEVDGNSNDLDNKSVVISIPSPTPSQEQMIEHIALQELDPRRQDGWIDVLEMFEDNLIDTKFKMDDSKKVEEPAEKKIKLDPQLNQVTTNVKAEMKITEPLENPSVVTVVATSRATVMPQLSPLSQPAELTTNVANVSQQLRTLLSSLNTTTVTTSSNIGTVAKSTVYKEKVNVTVATTSVTTPQVTREIEKVNSVIVKPKITTPKTSPTVTSQTSSNVVTSTTVSRCNEVIQSEQRPAVSSSSIEVRKAAPITNSTPRKTSMILNEMLQFHPAATTPQTSPGTITTASILGSSMPLPRTDFSTALVQAQPHVVSPVSTSTALSTSVTQFKPAITTTNLLHSQLTKTPVQRAKSLEEVLDKKKDDTVTTTSTTFLKQEITPTKFSTVNSTKMEDSQNVLLKQLLQNTGCASQSVTTTSTAVSTTTLTAPSLPIVPNLEAQLARPVPPTLSSLIPPILQNDSPQVKPIRQPIMNRETSFVSKPVPQPALPVLPAPTPVMPQQQLHIDIKKCLPPSRTPSRDELLSPPTPRSTSSQDLNMTTPPLVIKKEPMVPTTIQSPLLTPQEVKKEFVDESSQHSEVSDHSRGEVQMKEEMMEVEEKMDKEELKKLKRRMYQQKRRQNQMLTKETGQPKKRPRKSSKVDEDYDSYIDSLLANLRTLPPMVVSEPVLNKNFGVVPVFGAGDLNKLGIKEYDSRLGDLNGSYGNAVVPGYTDYYNSKPYGDEETTPEKPPASTQRGFYDQEFPLIKFDVDEDRKFDVFGREDSPDSIVSTSSPECSFFEPISKVPGLKLIEEDDDEEKIERPLTPKVPIITPIPIRLKPTGAYLKDYGDIDKENIAQEKEYHVIKPKLPTTPLKDSGNVTVTLTLTSSAAEDIMGVLRDLANILHIPAPTSYQLVERTSTPPSQKLGLYRTKGKDGKEGAPIDIQSILNGAAKFCKHCDIVILNNMIRKKLFEIPFLNRDGLKDAETLADGDELFFCSSMCYMQFAMINRSPSLSENKAAAIVDHLCQKDKAESLRKKQILEKANQIYQFESVSRKQFSEKMDVDIVHIKKEDFGEEMQVDSILRYQDVKPKTEENKYKNVKYKRYTVGCLQPANKHKKASDKETTELLYKLGVTVAPAKNLEDSRTCMFCHNIGDSVGDGPARLLNFDVDKWVHLNCALWSDGVYETVNGALMHLENALQQSLVSTCVHCNQLGATIRCFKTRCSNIYHLPCAIKDGCVFYKNKATYCTLHIQKGEKDNELTTLSVSRRVYVNRDENRQVAAVMHHSDQNNLLRVGSLIFLSVGQLLPHQLQNFHTTNYIYPIGYKIVRFYWSMRHLNKRCRYVCSIHDTSGRPEFRILMQEPNEEDVEFRDSTAKGVWNKVLEPVAALRKENFCVQIFLRYITGEDLFGLTEPAVVRVLESLPGIETLTDYKFKYGRNPLLELPLAINPSGAARSEPRLRSQLHWKRAHTQRTGSSARPVFAPASTGTGEVACPYSKQFVHSKSSQYKKMKQEWRNNVYLARSKIQGLGLYAARDLEKHTMVIEYIGEIIRTELAETREKKYEAKNRGIYMFRLDEERVVDATLSGGLARYINHSCNPNCVAEIVEVDRDLRIIIFAKRRIQRGEELAYDYKFDIEDDQHKISCMCEAPNCRKWMN